MSFLELFKLEKDKIVNSTSLLQIEKRAKTWGKEKEIQKLKMAFSIERECHFSLEL